MAACLTLVLSFASLAPAAAAAFGKSGSSCCRRSHAKCSCKGAAGRMSPGPAVSGPSCGGDCCQFTLGNGAAGGVVLPFSTSAALPVVSLGDRTSFQPSLKTHFGDDVRRQRPPPALLA